MPCIQYSQYRRCGHCIHVYTVTIVDIVFFVDIVASGYNVTHVYKALVDTTTAAPCVYIVAIGLITYN